MTAGLESYTTSTASVESSQGVSDVGRSRTAEQLTAVLLSEEGNYVQSLLLREAAVALDASVRDAVSASILSPLGRLTPPLPPPLPPPLAPLLAPLGPLTRPLTLPVDLARATLELQSMDETDTKRLDNLRILTELASSATRGGAASGADGNGAGGIGGVSAADVGRLAREAAERRTALARIGVRFGGEVARTQAERLRQRIQSSGELSELAGRIAVAGAERLEGVASAISSLDQSLSEGGTVAGSADDGPMRLLPGQVAHADEGRK